MPRPNVLIEKWLPIKELSVECQREGSTGLHPPPNRLHVWWARRPLIVSRAAVLASLLPQWSPDWPRDLLSKFPTENAYHEWFKRFIGILGDPVAARKVLDWAKEQGITKHLGAYGYKRAFTANPSQDDLKLARRLFSIAFGTESPAMIDPMAGGGSIPFEALRFGVNTVASELNPVAVVILHATLNYPRKF